ncbi:hypothetical protein L2E82_11248 [Cichorium intybus]|uniref:Uncharacterized protein n=1 Tax=Cichorium intybus TaxID=13427 RepID=A0ACB9GCA8_CICIN|nr:hypothetical protein L2E82_11248 [Cichorium intybus]
MLLLPSLGSRCTLTSIHLVPVPHDTIQMVHREEREIERWYFSSERRGKIDQSSKRGNDDNRGDGNSSKSYTPDHHRIPLMLLYVRHMKDDM